MNSKLKPQNSKFPYVVVNMAMTADGKIATANRRVSSFTSRRDRQHLLELRATVDAVLAGARTVDMVRINLGPGPVKFRRQRLKRGLAEFNLRVIVSRSGSINPQAEIFRHRFSPIIILTTSSAGADRLERLRGVADVVKTFGRNEINFRTAFRWLRRQWGVNRLLCEGGGELNDAVFRAGLVDELHLTICPKIFGGRLAPTIAEGRGIDRLTQAKQFRLKCFQRINDELFTIFVRG